MVKVTGLPHGITPPEVLQLFWGWQAKVTGTYIRSVDHEKRLEVRATGVGGRQTGPKLPMHWQVGGWREAGS